MRTIVTDIHDRYTTTDNDFQVIVFHNCNEYIFQWLLTSGILISFHHDKDESAIIVYRYNKEFNNDNDFYNYVLKNTSGRINCYSFTFDESSDIESYHIIHNNTFISVETFYRDAIEVYIIIDGVPTDVPSFQNINDVICLSKKNIYLSIVNYIETSMLVDIFDRTVRI